MIITDTRIMTPTYVCASCDNYLYPTDIAEADHGGYEEWWGAKVWHHQYVDVCALCGSEDIYTLQEWELNGWAPPKDGL